MGINNRGQTECIKSMRGGNGPQGKIQGQRNSKIPTHESELCQVEQLLVATRFPAFLPIKPSNFLQYEPSSLPSPASLSF